MLAGPVLLVNLAIGLIVFGPKKLPELAKTIGRVIADLKRTTEEMKESIGMKELGDIRSNLTGVDLFVDLAERVSVSMTKVDAESSAPADASASVPGETLLSADEASSPVEDVEKLRNEKLKGTEEKK